MVYLEWISAFILYHTETTQSTMAIETYSTVGKYPCQYLHNSGKCSVTPAKSIHTQ